MTQRCVGLLEKGQCVLTQYYQQSSETCGALILRVMIVAVAT